jgi:hypothetical protein
VGRYFMGLQKNAQLTHETPLRCNPVRLQFGLEMLSGCQQRLVAENAGSQYRFRLTRALPREERQLVVALAEVESDGNFTEVRIASEIADVAFPYLEKLGFEIVRT